MSKVYLENYPIMSVEMGKDNPLPDIKEGDTAISDVWYELYSHIVAKETNIADKDEINRIVEERYPLGKLDFRTH